MHRLLIVCGLTLLISLSSVQANETNDIERQRAHSNIAGGSIRITDQAELDDLKEKVVTHLKKLGASENGANLEFVRIKSAEKQVVAGSLWRLVAEINENNAQTDCAIKIWEKPWLNFAKLDVECGKEKRKYQWKSQ